MDHTEEVRKRLNRRTEALRSERAPYISEWRDSSDFIVGARGRYLVEHIKQPRRNEMLLNEEALLASNICASGMLSGITSPGRPWFKLTLADYEMRDYGPVKEWLAIVERVLYDVFSRSNFYTTMQGLFLEMAVFGQQPIAIFENFDNAVRFEPYTAGSYFLATNGERQIDTLYREYTLSVRQMVQRFGYKNCSEPVRKQYDRHDYEKTHEIIQAIEPNDEQRSGSKLAIHKPYASIYMEKGRGREGILYRSGFDERPFVCPRWDVVAEDVYASSYPGINCMGTNKSLQVEELDLATATEKMHNPPMVGDASIKTDGADLVAGGITYIANMLSAGKPGLQSLYDIHHDVRGLIDSIAKKEHRIGRHFYTDLFMMVADIDRTHVSAMEIAEKKEEKLLMLGPVLNRTNTEGLDPIIDRVFNICQKQGLFPEPPPELNDQKLDIEYISVLAQAQRAVSTSGIESTVAFAAQISEVWPEARHKINAFAVIDEFANSRGAPVGIIHDDKDAGEAAAAEQQQQQQQQMAAQAAQAAESANKLAGASMEGENALTKMMAANGGQMGGMGG